MPDEMFFVCEGNRLVCAFIRHKQLLRKKRNNAVLWPADDCFVAFDNDWALQQLLVLEQNLNHSFRIIDIIIRIELQFLELGVLAHQIFHRVFKTGNDLFQRLSVRRRLDVEDDFRFNSQFPGDRQGIL